MGEGEVEQGHVGPARLIAASVLAAVRQCLPDRAPDEIVKAPLSSLIARPGVAVPSVSCSGGNEGGEGKQGENSGAVLCRAAPCNKLQRSLSSCWILPYPAASSVRAGLWEASCKAGLWRASTSSSINTGMQDNSVDC